MKKQIIYSKFIPRVFAMTIDFVLLFILIPPLMRIISHYVFLYFFNDFFVMYGLNGADKEVWFTAVKMPEFVEYITQNRLREYLSITGALFLLNIIFMGVYFVTFWRKFGATPGKMFMRMKIVDADSLARPSVRNLIKRFLGYITAIIGIWFIVFSKRGMAVHDKIANTIVIKS